MLQNKDSNQSDNKIAEIHLLDYFGILVRHRWMILRNFGITVLAVAIISFLLPAKYTAVSTLMPPQENDQLSMANLLSEVTVPGISLPGKASPSDILVEILKSRSVGERVLSKKYQVKNDSLPLYEILDFESVDKALLHIKEFANFGANEQGIISVAVELHNRELAADVANAFVTELDEVKQEKSVTRAKNSRIYIETQLQETEKQLQESSQKLASFQEQNKAISLEAQMQISIQQVGELKGRIIAKEVQLGVMQQTMKPQNPLVIQTKNELEELRRQYKEMQYGNLNSKTNGSEEDFYLPFADVPKVGLQLAKLMREVKVQETVWKLLNQQYYQAKIEEARNTPTVQVLDRATPPVLRSSPKRKLLVISFGLLALFFSSFWAFGKEYVQKLETRPEEKQKLEKIVAEFRQDYEKATEKLRRKK